LKEKKKETKTKKQKETKKINKENKSEAATDEEELIKIGTSPPFHHTFWCKT